MAAYSTVASLLLLFSLAWGVASQPPFTECPEIGQDKSCQYRITFSPDGSATVTSDPRQGPYDGNDDALVGVVNNAGFTITSFSLTGPAIFDFDGDGLLTFCDNCSNPADQTGYAGPMNTFSVTSLDEGLVIFSGQGLLPGMSTYFSLEGQPTPSSIKIPAVNPTSPKDVGPSCSFDPKDCDFYFEGYQGSVPVLELGNGSGDNKISPAIRSSKDGGQAVNVINTNQGYLTSSPINNDNQNQFYGSDKYVHDRTFNYPQNVNDYRNKCFKLRLSSVQLAQGDNPMNLNPNDGNSNYPEERRCVVFATKQAS